MKRVVVLAGVLALAACSEAGEEAAGDAAETETEAAAEEDSDEEDADTGEDDAPEPEATETEDAPPQAAAKPVACARGEQTLFTCSVSGGKRIAVCGVTNANGQKTAQYRFGGSSAEITLDGGRFASVAYSGGGEAQIAFSNGATRYIVYSRTVRTGFGPEGNNPEFSDGVVVVRNGSQIASRQCTGSVESVDVMAGDQFGGVQSELFYEAY